MRYACLTNWIAHSLGHFQDIQIVFYLALLLIPCIHVVGLTNMIDEVLFFAFFFFFFLRHAY